MQPEFISVFRVRKALNMAFRSADFTAEAREKLEKAIDEIPKVDVAPVVRATWRDPYGECSTARCSRCGSDFDVTDKEPSAEIFRLFGELYKYCPNCGAKMDGGKP